jgi:hypothetical protein
METELKDVKAKSDYTLILTFHNGEIKVFDMKPYLNFGVFKELKDLNLFKKVRMSFDTVEWPNELDLDPEILYNESKAIVTN